MLTTGAERCQRMTRAGFIDHTPLIAVAFFLVLAVVVVASLPEATPDAETTVSPADEPDASSPSWLPFALIGGGLAAVAFGYVVREIWIGHRSRRRQQRREQAEARKQAHTAAASETVETADADQHPGV